MIDGKHESHFSIHASSNFWRLLITKSRRDNIITDRRHRIITWVRNPHILSVGDTGISLNTTTQNRLNFSMPTSEQSTDTERCRITLQKYVSIFRIFAFQRTQHRHLKFQGVTKLLNPTTTPVLQSVSLYWYSRCRYASICRCGKVRVGLCNIN